ncbi:uncharacterized protein G2W53_038312 [Senna tora]|uniref:Uncharacterized protein n=1 Tax=Senna tora TaxID=362788 RepID=A0A834W533_9FABA|nr:uncharacterized protein G2W53_038312 [Senna tora]
MDWKRMGQNSEEEKKVLTGDGERSAIKSKTTVVETGNSG